VAAWRAILLATAALLPCACSSEPSTSAAVPAEPDRIDVVAAFYPLQFVTERVGALELKLDTFEERVERRFDAIAATARPSGPGRPVHPRRRR